MAGKDKYALFLEMVDEIFEASNLIQEYDYQCHDYNGIRLYRVESMVIRLIGSNPGISAAECARKMNRTLSASSQLIKKLKKKQLVIQVKNESNNRINNLYLTEEGEKIYEKYRQLAEKNQRKTYHLLAGCGEEDFHRFIQIMKLLNIGFHQRVEEGREMAWKDQ